MPNRTLPSRTRVDPSCTATTKSSLMPIEQADRPSRSHSPRTTRKPGRAASGPPSVGPTVIRPSTTRPADTALVTSDSASSGAQPPLVGSADGVDLHEHMRAGRPLGQLDDQRRSVDGLVDVDEIDDLAHLVGLQLPDEMHGKVERSAVELGDELLRVVLADRGEPDRSGGLDDLDRVAFGDGQDLDGRTAGFDDLCAHLLQSLGETAELCHSSRVTSGTTAHRNRRQRRRADRQAARRRDP